jgi:hypothetical protein
MRTITAIAAVLNILSVVALLVVARKWSRHVYEEGHQDGYNKGRVDAENWWFEAGQEVDQAQKKIREERS